MVFRVIGVVAAVAALGMAGCGDDSGSGGAGAGATNLCVTGVPNGVLETGEQCDGLMFSGAATCESLTNSPGMLMCLNTCEISTMGCSMGSNTGIAGSM